MQKATLPTFLRILYFICAAALTIVLFVPLWRIELDAPQYPEGLKLLIYTGKLGGNVDIVNGLNHYIGMKTLHANDFMEFTVLPYFVGFFALLALLVAIIAQPKWVYLFFILFIAFAVLAMVDFWRWEYHYGHDLNPDAAIIVPGMSYQPPLIGFKQLLNFGAFSIPDIGGWIFIGVGVLSLISVLLLRRKKNKTLGAFSMVLLLSMVGLSSCNQGPELLKYGMDNCYACKMTISDQRFGAEIITKKGRAYKFDDSYCMLGFLKNKEIEYNQVSALYITNFTGKHQLIKVEDALLLQSNAIRGPMGGTILASDINDSLNALKTQFAGNTLRWSDIYKNN